jgi:hypothetical protein
VDIAFPHGTGTCDFDIKVKYQDDDTATWGNVDLGEWPKITLYWDGNNTRAEGE